MKDFNGGYDNQFFTQSITNYNLMGLIADGGDGDDSGEGDYSKRLEKLPGIIIPGFASTQLRAWSILDCPYSPLERWWRSGVAAAATMGSIVCTASVMAERGAGFHTDYGVSKHAVLGLMQSASVQLGPHGIRVNCVSPSALPALLGEKMGLGTAGDVETLLGPFISLKGAALTLEDVAAAVGFLASGESGFVTGHNLVVDGGLTGLPS